MSWFSNLVGVFSPRRAAEMEAWQAQRELIKRWGYDAGGYDKENRHWLAPMESSETTASHDRDTVRARARDLERNSDIAKSVVHAFKRNVVGSGFKLQARTAKTKFNADIELAWRRWTKARNCDVTGQQSFNQLLRMAVERKKVDGGILFKKCYTPGGLVPFKLQALEVDELDTSQYTPKNPANKIINGIEYDAYNKPVGYWIRRYSLDGYQIIGPEYVEAKDIIFYFQKSRPSQVREMSDMAPTLTRIRDVNEFVKAISIKERIAACLSAFITKTSSTPTGGMGRGLGAPPAAPKHSYEGKRITPRQFFHIRMVALVEHGPRPYTKVPDIVILTEYLLHLRRIAVDLSHVYARAVGYAVAYARYSLCIGLVYGQVVEPGGKLHSHLVMVGKGITESPAVTACRVYIHGTRVAGLAHGLVIAHAVGKRRHHGIVGRHQDDGRRSKVSAHGIVVSPVLHETIVTATITKEANTRALVRLLLIHGDNRIEKDREIRTGVERCMGTDRGS